MRLPYPVPYQGSKRGLVKCILNFSYRSPINNMRDLNKDSRKLGYDLENRNG